MTFKFEPWSYTVVRYWTQIHSYNSPGMLKLSLIHAAKSVFFVADDDWGGGEGGRDQVTFRFEPCSYTLFVTGPRFICTTHQVC